MKFAALAAFGIFCLFLLSCKVDAASLADTEALDEVLEALKSNGEGNYLLESDASIDSVEIDTGYSALILSVIHFQKDEFGRLLEDETIDVNAADNNGKTALIWAAELCHKEMVNMLLNDPRIDVNANDHINTALIRATTANTKPKGDYAVIVKMLLKDGRINVNAADAKGSTALILASYLDRILIVNFLLKEEKIDINAVDKNGNTALIWAAEMGHKEILIMLLKDKRTHGSGVALIRAACNNHAGIVRMLLKDERIISDKDHDENLKTALIWASHPGHEEVVEALNEDEIIYTNSTDLNSCADNSEEIITLLNDIVKFSCKIGVFTLLLAIILNAKYQNGKNN